MKLTVLAENMAGDKYPAEHGLSQLIELNTLTNKPCKPFHILNPNKSLLLFHRIARSFQHFLLLLY